MARFFRMSVRSFYRLSTTLRRSVGYAVGLSLVLSLPSCTASHEPSESHLIHTEDQRIGGLVDRVADGLSDHVQAYLRELTNTLDLESTLSSAEKIPSISSDHARVLQEFYAARDYEPIFMNGVTLTQPGIDVAQQLIASDVHGFDPHTFHASEIQEAISQILARETKPPIQGSFQLLPADRVALVQWLQEKDDRGEPLPNVEQVFQTLIEERTRSPIPGLTRLIEESVGAIQPVARASTDLELLLADGFMQWGISQRFHNLRYISTEMANARGWTIMVDGKRWETKQLGSPFSEQMPDPSTLTPIDHQDVILTLAKEYLENYAETGDFRTGMREIVPPFVPYKNLIKASQRYRSIVLMGGWKTLEGPADLKQGDVGPRVVALKNRLHAEGYFDGDVRNEAFNRELYLAVLHYQQTHQLSETGNLTDEMLTSLNVPAVARLAQIQVTMQRWRESRIGFNYDDDYFVVNVPDFHVELWHHDELIHRMRSVVGKLKYWRDENGNMQFEGRTPLFSDVMQYVVFNPYWNVPKSIEVSYAKQIAEDPFWLQDNGFEYVDLPDGARILRQLPGNQNALGRVKFLFPNEHDVYMHDTNQPGLFNRPTREYSHGCVRVQDALGFAALLWSRDRKVSLRTAKKFVKDQLELGTETWFSLIKPIPVHIEYYVVRVDDDGYANFLADFHRFDKPLVEARTSWLKAYIHEQEAASVGLIQKSVSDNDTL